MFKVIYRLPESYGEDAGICQNPEEFDSGRELAQTIKRKKEAFPGILCTLVSPIAEAKRTNSPRYGMTSEGYTVRSGAPTSIMIRLEGEKRWRRVMVWQFSNAGTIFLRIGGVPVLLNEHDIQPHEYA